jgi:erythromycin esterase-like protein
VLKASVHAQLQGHREVNLMIALVTSTSGTFKARVVSCDTANNTCVAKIAKQDNQTARMMHAQCNGGSNAAKEAKASDTVQRQKRAELHIFKQQVTIKK